MQPQVPTAPLGYNLSNDSPTARLPGRPRRSTDVAPRAQQCSMMAFTHGIAGRERPHGRAGWPCTSQPSPCRVRHAEHGTLGVQRDRQPKREVAPEAPRRSTVAPLGQNPALDAKRLEGGHLLRFGREPRQAGMVEHVVEREEPSQQHLL